MRTRITLLAALSLIVAGCLPQRVAPPAQPGGGGRVCTEIGCSNLLTVELADVDLKDGKTYTVDICVDGQCSEAEVTIDQGFGQAHNVALQADRDRVEYQLAAEGYGETAEVSFALAGPDGTVLAETEGEAVPIERSQPNGPGCPPICFTGRLIV